MSATLVTAALIIAALVLGRDILVPLALAGISCFVLVPIVVFLKKRGIPQGFAEGTVLLVVVVCMTAASIGLSSQLLSLAADLPQYRTNVLEKVRSIVGSSVPSGLVGRAIDAVETYQRMINNELQFGVTYPEAQPPAENASGKDGGKVQIVKGDDESTALYGLRILAEPLTQAALTFLFTLFLLMQFRDLRDRIVRIFGVEHITETTAAMSDAGDRLIALFTGQVILNASFGTFVGLSLFALGVPNAPLWGVMAFVMRFVPFVGSYVAAIPPILLAAAVDPGWTKALLTLAIFAIGEPIMGQVLEPLVLGRRAGLSPFAMILATSFWTLTWGPIGLVLAAPITLILVVLGKYVPDLEFITVLLGDEPPLSEQQNLYHRLLSSDVFAATEQIAEAEEKAPYAEVLDKLVFPALALSARDRRRGRLDKEAQAELSSTIGAIAEKSRPEKSKPEKPDKDPIMVLVPVRGEFDELATRFAVSAINRDHPGLACAMNEASGLTALAFLADIGYADLQKIVLMTVTGLAEGGIRILVDRARSLFPGVEVVLLDVSSRQLSLPSSRDRFVAPEIFTSFARFTNSLEHSLSNSSDTERQTSREVAPASH
ncbi:AI-2E family transporter [Hyphomicrobium sp. DY-1]|uniref:AI-2E family transporter n=1 Tax=Hyphomicrobium sp. DY-1 TaxID=3075650 RepID=UPI0039C0A8EF